MLNTEESRDGALACIDALNIIETIAECSCSEGSIEECFKIKRSAISSVLLAAGEVTPRVQGVILAMAEYIYACNHSGIPNLEKWRPEVTMTEKDFQEYMREKVIE